MKTHEKPLLTSVEASRAGSRPEEFEPPGITDLATLTDGRMPGEYVSVYPWSAWLQIILELVFVISVLICSLFALLWLAKSLVLGPPHTFLPWLLGDLPANEPILIWVATGLGGACGGCVFSLKWLYHTVAKMRWHRDRLVWRLTVPLLSGVLSTFAGLMIVSGLVPFLSNTALTNPAVGAAFGFFVGLFSDNLLAGLQRLAFGAFGTVDRRAGGDAHREVHPTSTSVRAD